MKWLAIAAASAAVAVILLAGEKDIIRFRKMKKM